MNNWRKVFGLIWTGQFFSLLTSSIVNFAIILWISIQTGSAAMLAWAAIAGLLPQGVLSPFVGVLIDRWNRKWVMILADGFIALCTLALAALFWFDVVQMWHIFLILGLRSVGSTFHMPAMQASIPLLAPQEQMTRIAGISQMINSVSSIAGPALGALFISLWDMQFILLLDIVGAIMAIGSLLFVAIPNTGRKESMEKNERIHMLREIREGIRIMIHNRGVAWTFLFSFIAGMIYQPVNTLFPLMTIRHFGGNEFQVSLVEILWGIGFLVGGAIMGIKLYRRMNRVVIINLMYMVMGAVFLTMGTLPGSAYAVYVSLALVGGMAAAVYLSLFTSVIQTNIDPAALGRVFSMFYTLAILPTLISLVATGFFTDYIGVALSLIVLGILMLVCGVLAFLPVSAIKLDKS